MSVAPVLPGLTASDPAFESAWAVWVRVTREASGGAHSAHKAAAREEFYRQRKRGVLPGLLELVAAIEAQGQSERWRAGVIPDFRTWLHQQRWGDDPAALTWNGNGKGRGSAGHRSDPDQQPMPRSWMPPERPPTAEEFAKIKEAAARELHGDPD